MKRNNNARAIAGTLAGLMAAAGWAAMATTTASASDKVEGCMYASFAKDAASLSKACWLETKDWNFEPGKSKEATAKIGDFTLKYTVSADSDQRHNYQTGNAPIWDKASLGHNDNGVGVPVFYNTVDPQIRTANGDYTVKLSNISLVDKAGKAVSDWKLILMDAESTHASSVEDVEPERTILKASSGVQEMLFLPAMDKPDSTCAPQKVDGGLVCLGRGEDWVGAMVGSASAPTSASISLRHRNGSGMAGAFGVMVPEAAAKADPVKESPAPVQETSPEPESPEGDDSTVVENTSPSPQPKVVQEAKAPQAAQAPAAPAKAIVNAPRPLASTGR